MRGWRLGAALAALTMLAIAQPLGASTTTSPTALPLPLTELLDKHHIPRSQVSLVVQAMDGNGIKNAPPLLRFNAKKARNPASVIKLLTTLAALELLGPGYQWETAYLADGEIDGGVLRGDLIFKGGGDPFISVEQLLGHILTLRQSGLHTIEGELVIDNTRFAAEHHDRAAFDEKPLRMYNVGADAALVNFSASQLVIEPRGDDILVRIEPALTGINVVNEIKAKDGRCLNPATGWSYRVKGHAHDDSGDGGDVGGDVNGLTVEFHGVYRKDCGAFSIPRTLLPNTEYTHRLFAELWRTMGGVFDGGYRIAATPENAQLLLTRDSDLLADIISGINKFSNNVMTRQLMLTIAAEKVGEPATVDAALETIDEWLTDNKIKMPKLIIENGSGLSRKSRMSADGLTALLRHGWRATYRPEFLSSLPLAAVDGTLRKRLTDSPLRGRARIKTGLIDGVRSMAGYLHANDNRHYAVVMMIDSGKVNYWNGNELQDSLLEWVYRRH